MEAAKSQMEEAESTALQTRGRNWNFIKNSIKLIKRHMIFFSPQMEKRGKIIESIPSWKLFISCCLEICPETKAGS